MGSGPIFTMQNHGDGPNTVPVVFADRPQKAGTFVCLWVGGEDRSR